jgi:flagellar biosynthesis/type III secretory pathway M-ring protein FliF/YscJ
MGEFIVGIVWSLAPTVLVGLLFWLIMHVIVRADRAERAVFSRMEAEERARRGLDEPKAGLAPKQ